MAASLTAYRGCLLGMAVGDAMGYTVDSRSLQEIREDYGPNGLLGYDLVNGYADVTSYTQLAAFTCNGLLLAVTRGQMLGRMAPFVKYLGLSSREWAISQRPWGRPDRTYCWLLQQPELCRRLCMDTRMLDTLSRDTLGSPDEPKNTFVTPGGLTTAVGVGLFYSPERISQSETDLLGAEAVALTHGGALAFLSGSALAHLISRSLSAPELPLRELVQETVQSIKDQFGHLYTQTFEVCNLLTQVLAMAQEPGLKPVEVMERLECYDSAQVLAGAVYACLVCSDDFDRTIITAVNHSGKSAAVGAVAGALQGIRLGEDALPEFYMECLESGDVLRELADDLYNGCPMEMGNKLFDLDWDRKYVHGGK